jgi:general L-amino acid transport system substrate-binding protein
MRLLTALLLILLLAAPAQAGPVLERVLRDRIVRCAAPPDAPGFNITESRSSPRGFDVDLCRAVAAAVLGDPEKLIFVSLPPAGRATALANGTADLLARDAVATLSRSIAPEPIQVGTTFNTGIGFMVRTATNIRSIEGLDGAVVCMRRDAETARLLAQAMSAKGFRYELAEFDSQAETFRAFFGNKCDVVMANILDLAAARGRTDYPNFYRITATYLTMESWGPVVARGDAEWAQIVRWTVHALIAAEVVGVSQYNINETVTSRERPVRRLLGAEGNLGQLLGLEPDWVVNVIRAVGNYGEIYDRHFGPSSVMNIERGPNDIWFRGGMLTAPAFQ